MAEVRKDKYGRPDRTHLLSTSSANDQVNPRMIPATVLKNMSKEERRALLATEYVFQIVDEKGRQRQLDKKFLKEPWIELKEPELIKEVFIHVAADKLNYIEDYRFFVTKNCPILNDVKDMVKKKAELIAANKDAINEALIRNKTWSHSTIESKTFYEVEAIVEMYKEQKPTTTQASKKPV